MLPIMLVSNTCALGGLNTNNWVGVNLLVIMLALTIASVAYILTGLFLTTQQAARVRGYIRFEYVQAMIGVSVIIAVLALSSIICNVGSQLTPQGQSPFAFAQTYVGNLLFVQGTGLVTQMYTASVQYTVYANVMDFFASSAIGTVNSIFGSFFPNLNLPAKIEFVPGQAFTSTFNTYSSILTDRYTPLVIATFAMLFLQYLLIPIIQGGALVVVLPLALLMRSMSFVGPRLRDTADQFIAISIALYFIFPLTFVMDQQILNWTFCINGVKVCNPYIAYAGAYTVPTATQSGIFTSNPVALPSWLNLPGAFYSSAFGNSFFNTNSGASNPLQAILSAPNDVMAFGASVAQYLFEGIVLIALNMAITITFAVGLARGISSALAFVGGGGSLFG
ncbi:MAG: hypothetical protein KGH59_04175 [Candidatus Micrarchaeota archaeon]|nr:hypothetical protein [Candidatus Micrarchaeota archaeon]MDE1804949.1 hypothetical protein [Candidatus Micrarchaeota archaeon]MDE1846770.1 hypothetical protein [Candidatus Micrarchaeota archaeon]